MMWFPRLMYFSLLLYSGGIKQSYILVNSTIKPAFRDIVSQLTQRCLYSYVGYIFT